MGQTEQQRLMIIPLGSGSKGNCTYVGTWKRGVLVDAGLSAKQTMLRMEAAGLGGATIECVFVGHEHSDHVGAARVLQRKLRSQVGHTVPFWMTEGTYAAAPERCRPEVQRWLVPGVVVNTPTFRVTGISSPHDAREPVVFVVEMGALRAAVLTDMGRPTQALEEALRSADVALVEFNHDRKMLLDGHYSWPLKQRVLGPEGHLSNAQAADLVARGASERLQHLVLGHLSADNNTPQAALAAAMEGLARAGLRNVEVMVAAQDAPLAKPASATIKTPVRAQRHATDNRGATGERTGAQMSLFA